LSEFLAGRGGEYGGELAAPISADELASIARLGAADESFNAAFLPQLEATARGDYLTALPSNPFLGGAIDFIRRSVNDAFDVESAKQRALFSRAGHSIQESSPFSDAASRLEIDRQDRLASQISGAVLPLYESERARQADAANQARTVLENSRSVLEARALPRLIADLGIERGQALFSERLNRLLALFQTLGDVTFRTGQNARSSSTSFGSQMSGNVGL
jgi:hypothetical protein